MSAQIELTHPGDLPYEIGRFSFGWRLFVFLLLVLTGIGGYAYSQQLIHGEVVTGMRDIGTMGGAPWGLYITFLVYFVGISFAAIAIAVFIRLLNLDHLRPIARMAEVVTVVSLLLGALTIVADVGQPGRALVNLLRYARPGSPFFGTFTLDVFGFLIGSVVFLYLDCRRDAYVMSQRPGRLQGLYRFLAAGYEDTIDERARHRRTTFWLALAILPLLIVAHSTLGFVFGLQVGRPGWFGALQAPAFLALATVSGVGLLIVVAALLRYVLRLNDILPPAMFHWLGNVLMVFTGIYLYFMVVELLTTIYGANQQENHLMTAIWAGKYAPIFWTAVATLLIPLVLLFRQYVRNRYSLAVLVLSGVLVNIAAVAKRYLIVVPSQTDGSLLPYAPGIYVPSAVEIGVIVGLLALGALLFTLFLKLFPITELGVKDAQEPPPSAGPATRGRRSLALAMVVAGFALQVVTFFFLAAPLGQPTSVAFSDPRLPFAPLLFILGIALVFLAAVVYEVFPEREVVA